MKQKNYETGKLGERIAEDFLTKNNYKLIARNFHTRFGEIDLIFSKNNKLIFVEVKLKVGEDFGTPEEMINRHKIRQIEMTGQSFLLKYPEYEKFYESLQIDAICIVTDENHNIIRINHYENIS
ncbi:MAG TPA: YraN family protein [Patescibacteria group bacterium]|nr:YraN family protein [Patescibacteria group bacterium]